MAKENRRSETMSGDQEYRDTVYVAHSENVVVSCRTIVDASVTFSLMWAIELHYGKHPSFAFSATRAFPRFL